MKDPVFGSALLLRVGDAVSTVRDIGSNAWEPATFLGYVIRKPVRVPGGWTVQLDTGLWSFRNTQTLAIWEAG